MRLQNAAMGGAYHHGDLRAALVESALRALDRRGKLPSWRALARTCGVSATAPYRHFRSPEDLQAAAAAACFRRFLAFIDPRLAALREPFPRLEAAIRGYIEFACAHPHWYELMFGRTVDFHRHPEARDAGMAAFGRLRDIVRDCGSKEPDGDAYVLWAAHHGLADLLRLEVGTRQGVAPQQAVDRLVRMSLDFLRPRRRAQYPRAPREGNTVVT